ncbi:MAG: cell division protein [Gammaproteobacteria bacterium]|nr:cell division protein [Gammaproteobacteria bacterium]RPG21484.1 MAG: penicillin-binding protein 2 [Gammaproteobacteria bacterium TMED57]
MSFWRHYLFIVCFIGIAGALSVRVVYLGVTERDFLQEEGDKRSIYEKRLPAMRGMIYDRNGEALAVSTPVFAVAVNPLQFDANSVALQQLGKILDLDVESLRTLLSNNAHRGYLYLKRHVSWEHMDAIRQLRLAHLTLEPEYRRYYPAGESSAHVVGLTDIDDMGLEGIELTFENSLRGEAGSKTVLRDREGRIVDDLDYGRAPRFGSDLHLSIDSRLQYIAYRELKSAVVGHGAKSGSLIMVDVKTGEILALVNQPSFNPNGPINQREPTRNRVVTDFYDPGSTIKPFTAMAALESGRYQSETMIETSPGYFWVDSKMIQDPVNLNTITLAEAIQKSSQVAIAKVALDLPRDAVFDVLQRSGLGDYVGTGLPGEVTGLFSNVGMQSRVSRTAMAYGYGFTVTPLQLASAYVALAGHGSRLPLSILKQDRVPEPQQVFDAEDAREVIAMMERVTQQGGTATNADIDDYRVAGKTGTARVLENGRYNDERHVAWFAGLAPVSDPRIVMVVLVNEPNTDRASGGKVAAPVFGRVAAHSLRLLGVRPDNMLNDPLPMDSVLAGSSL